MVYGLCYMDMVEGLEFVEPDVRVKAALGIEKERIHKECVAWGSGGGVLLQVIGLWVQDRGFGDEDPGLKIEG